jgi:hypothetical protein
VEFVYLISTCNLFQIYLHVDSCCRDDLLLQLTSALCSLGLCSLNIERCSITSRTIQKVADALNAGSVLEQLCIGRLDLSSRSLTIFNVLLFVAY